MPRLVDRFRSGPVTISSISQYPPEKHSELVSWMREDPGKGVPVIAIDNVAKYVLVNEARQQWDLADIPNAAPPWPLAWYEFRVPGKYVEDFPEELAWWVDAEERDEGGWRLHCYAWGWIRGHTDVVGPMGGHIVDVATDGTVEMLTPMGFKGWTPELAYGTLTYLLPVLMANSFAHCAMSAKRS